MPKYRAEITLEIDTPDEMPDITIKGTDEQLMAVVESLPLGDPANDDKTTIFGTISLRRYPIAEDKPKVNYRGRDD